jgi:hypothetical protein
MNESGWGVIPERRKRAAGTDERVATLRAEFAIARDPTQLALLIAKGLQPNHPCQSKRSSLKRERLQSVTTLSCLGVANSTEHPAIAHGGCSAIAPRRHLHAQQAGVEDQNPEPCSQLPPWFLAQPRPEGSKFSRSRCAARP